jgi:hypothetical protein
MQHNPRARETRLRNHGLIEGFSNNIRGSSRYRKPDFKLELRHSRLGIRIGAPAATFRAGDSPESWVGGVIVDLNCHTTTCKRWVLDGWSLEINSIVWGHSTISSREAFDDFFVVHFDVDEGFQGFADVLFERNMVAKHVFVGDEGISVHDVGIIRVTYQWIGLYGVNRE